MEYKGLSTSEVQTKNSLGLQNTTIDSYTPTTIGIILKNILSIINIVLIPLIVYLVFLSLYMEALSMGLFIVINTITSMFDELRIKREIEQLKTKFQIKAKVIRDGVEKIIPVSEIVTEDLIKVSEGENIVADGIIIDSSI
jgi:magnesium-transporting ATPase (P-type)